LSGPNWTKVDLIGPNKNCLIFRENKLSSKFFREKRNIYIYIYYITIQNNYLFSHIIWVCDQLN